MIETLLWFFLIIFLAIIAGSVILFKRLNKFIKKGVSSKDIVFSKSDPLQEKMPFRIEMETYPQLNPNQPTYCIVVKTKTKEEKGWTFLKEISVTSYSEYSALCEASQMIAGTDNPRINQASIPSSATAVLKSKNISYRFEIKSKTDPSN